jgi:hypothetical protein
MPPAFVRLHHGTTRDRAERLIQTGPNPWYVEPGGTRGTEAGGFSTVESGATDRGLALPEEYARRKDKNFPTEGGPVILELDVPVEVVQVVYDDPIGRLTAETNEIRFEPGSGLEELLRVWPSLPKRVIVL